jgi:hypothetical protein
MKYIKRYGEIFYEVRYLSEFVDTCTDKDISILSVEFYTIENNQLSPYSLLQSIDSGDLYDETKPEKENAKNCNAFIKACAAKMALDVFNLYFNVVTDRSVSA